MDVNQSKNPTRDFSKNPPRDFKLLWQLQLRYNCTSHHNFISVSIHWLFLYGGLYSHLGVNIDNILWGNNVHR